MVLMQCPINGNGGMAKEIDSLPNRLRNHFRAFDAGEALVEAEEAVGGAHGITEAGIQTLRTRKLL
jgi:hypothetical protein